MYFMKLLYRVLSLTFIASCVNFTALYILSKSGSSLPGLTIFTFMAIVATATLFSLINKYVYSSGLSDLYTEKSKLSIQTIYLWIGLSIAFTLLSVGCGYLINDGSFQISKKSFTYAIYFSFISALLPGVVEEICYRWFLYGMLRKNINKFVAATIAGIIFGLMHINQADTIDSKILLLCSGVSVTYLFCAIYEKTESIWPGVILHTVWDMFYTDNLLLIQHISKLVTPQLHNLVIITLTNHDTLLSGGDFGLESSLSSIILYLLAAVMIIKCKKKLLIK